MSEIAAFFAATDRLALWVGRFLLWGALLLIVAGLVAAKWAAYRERRPRLRVSAVCRLSRDLDTTPNAVIVARAGMHYPVYHEEPNGQMVRLVGVEDMGSLWPADLLNNAGEG